MSEAQKQLEYWLNDPYFDDATKQELMAVRNDEKEVEERFYKELEFGTGGLRGIIGAGTNRMNTYTVRKATQGLANYILKNGDPSKGVVISYDCRRFSPNFAEVTALCLATNGIKAYVSDELRPTPELSFAVRYFGCQAGVMITASHNPPEYNGYKAYWEDGAQMTPPNDVGVIAEVRAITDYHDMKTMSREEAAAKGLYETWGSKVDDAYMEAVEPYNYEEAVNFSGAYLSGYLADKYDVSADESIERANERVKNSTIAAFNDTTGMFQMVTPDESRVSFSNGKIRYSLLPVWMLNIKYLDKMYQFAINGQTGKVVGNYPVNEGKKKKFFWKVAGICYAAAAVVAYFLLH